MTFFRNQSLLSPDYHRTIRPTRLGMHFLFVTAFAMLGGALRGFNLLLVIAGLLTGAMLMQWRWARGNLMALSFSRRLPKDLFAGDRFEVQYEIENKSRWMTLWLLRLEDKLITVGNAKGSQATNAVRVVMPKIGPSMSVVERSPLKISRRGEMTFGPATIASSFPFDLLTSRVESCPEETLWVYPKLLNLNKGWQRFLFARHGGMTAASNRSGRSEGEFFGLRPYQTGDAVQRIHWRTSARLDEPVVTQYEQTKRYSLCFLVDGFLCDESSDHDVELAISLVATMIKEMSRLRHSRLVLGTAGKTGRGAVASGGAVRFREAMQLLARLQVSDSPDFITALDQLKEKAGPARDLVVVSPRSMADALEQVTEETRQWLRPWLRRRTFRWIDVSSEKERTWF